LHGADAGAIWIGRGKACAGKQFGTVVTAVKTPAGWVRSVGVIGDVEVIDGLVWSPAGVEDEELAGRRIYGWAKEVDTGVVEPGGRFIGEAGTGRKFPLQAAALYVEQVEVISLYCVVVEDDELLVGGPLRMVDG